MQTAQGAQGAQGAQTTQTTQGVSQSQGALTYRPFQESDLDALAAIAASVWRADAPDELRLLAGVVDFATFAKRATFSCVAQLDGRAIGVVLARAGSPELTHVAHWEEVAAHALVRLEACSPRYATHLVRTLEEEALIDAQLLAESGEDPTYELVLFAVSSEARGQGVGVQLLSRAQRYLVDQGAQRMFLFTDTSCTWQFYEKRGMVRRAERMVHPLTYDPGDLDYSAENNATQGRCDANMYEKSSCENDGCFEMYVYATDLPE